MFIEIDRYLRRTGMTKSSLSKKALGDHATVAQIMSGHRSCTEYTAARLRRFMAENPEGVARRRPGPR